MEKNRCVGRWFSKKFFLVVDCSAELIGIYPSAALLSFPFPALVGSREVCRSFKNCIADYLLISSNVVCADE